MGEKRGYTPVNEKKPYADSQEQGIELLAISLKFIGRKGLIHLGGKAQNHHSMA